MTACLFFGKRSPRVSILSSVRMFICSRISAPDLRFTRYCPKKPPRSSKALRKKKINKIITGTSMPVEIQNNTSDM